MPSLDMPVPDSADEALDFYKSQIRELEDELADFQASSKELERELEKELEHSERQHRELVTKNEALRYEVEEWKTKYKQAKAEANSAQNTLQKEVTSLREQNRALNLKLRDIEVANDEFERKERIVTSSMEELESKYAQAFERSIIQEEEIAAGEQEREALRIEAQRLRDELSDLKVEQEITVEKLNNALAIAAKHGHGSLHHVPPPAKFQSPLSETSSGTSDPSTPITNCTSTSHSINSSPPSPPMSEVSTTPSQSSRISKPLDDPAMTPRPRHQLRKPRVSVSGNTALPLPASRSLTHIRGLIGQMQRLEQRVHHARSKLPAPVTTPPRSSPRLSNSSNMPTTVTVRSHKKSRPTSTTSSVTSGDYDQDNLPGGFTHSTRLSFSTSERPDSRIGSGTNYADRPLSRTSDRPLSRQTLSRPASRTSFATPGYESRIPHRPQSRTGMSGRQTPSNGLYDRQFDNTPISKEKSRRSIGSGDLEPVGFGYGSRRNTLNTSGATGIPVPGRVTKGTGIPRRSIGSRQSGVNGNATTNGDERGSTGLTGTPTIGMRRKKLSGVGEG